MKSLRLLALICLCLLPACSRHSVKDPPSQTYQGFEIKVLSVEGKGSEWTDSNNQRFPALGIGHQIAVAEISFHALSKDGGALSIHRLELSDDAGKTYPSLLTNIVLMREANLERAVPWQVPFEVSEGAEFKTLRIADVAFDLK